MGHEALREHWPPILTDVLRYSTAPTRAPAKPRKRPTNHASGKPIKQAPNQSADQRATAMHAFEEDSECLTCETSSHIVAPRPASAPVQHFGFH
jgi:hypothetical protein